MHYAYDMASSSLEIPFAILIPEITVLKFPRQILSSFHNQSKNNYRSSSSTCQRGRSAHSQSTFSSSINPQHITVEERLYCHATTTCRCYPMGSRRCTSIASQTPSAHSKTANSSSSSTRRTAKTKATSSSRPKMSQPTKWPL